jgi:hypothetical protein
MIFECLGKENMSLCEILNDQYIITLIISEKEERSILSIP